MGRKRGSAGISKSEEKIIKLGVQKGMKISDIAEALGRSRQSIYQRVDRMKARGEFDQMVADLGQLDV